MRRASQTSSLGRTGGRIRHRPMRNRTAVAPSLTWRQSERGRAHFYSGADLIHLQPSVRSLGRSRADCSIGTNVEIQTGKEVRLADPT